ncbi:hypothetical protein PGTUg99_021068 [Puccinia graminis f. sp. tritici]|uniref:Uncharacterized protein n=1 Tax=Puccinia graminis f. sp. tritici TaxID=56615 RepID=A0A5B0LWF0_PUCGR|nr:hypothetical protein PGTUg99_021068 [Puccinia graminis f. sp. tritici]
MAFETVQISQPPVNHPNVKQSERMNSYIAGYQCRTPACRLALLFNRECHSTYEPDDQEPTLPVGVLALPTTARNMGSSPIAPAVYS